MRGTAASHGYAPIVPRAVGAGVGVIRPPVSSGLGLREGAADVLSLFALLWSIPFVMIAVALPLVLVLRLILWMTGAH